MAGTLGELLRDTRRKRGWTLREVEEKTGIHNAHLSQIESGVIAKPAPNILFVLAAAYDLSYDRLLKLAGHFQDKSQAQRSLQGAALRAIEELTPDEQQAALKFMQELAHQRMTSGSR